MKTLLLLWLILDLPGGVIPPIPAPAPIEEYVLSRDCVTVRADDNFEVHIPRTKGGNPDMTAVYYSGDIRYYLDNIESPDCKVKIVKK